MSYRLRNTLNEQVRGAMVSDKQEWYRLFKEHSRYFFGLNEEIKAEH